MRRRVIVGLLMTAAFYLGTIAAIVIGREWEWLRLNKATERRRRGL